MVRESYARHKEFALNPYQEARYLEKEHEGIYKCRKCGREETRNWKTSRKCLLQ